METYISNKKSNTQNRCLLKKILLFSSTTGVDYFTITYKEFDKLVSTADSQSPNNAIFPSSHSFFPKYVTTPTYIAFKLLHLRSAVKWFHGKNHLAISIIVYRKHVYFFRKTRLENNFSGSFARTVYHITIFRKPPFHEIVAPFFPMINTNVFTSWNTKNKHAMQHLENYTTLDSLYS